MTSKIEKVVMNPFPALPENCFNEILRNYQDGTTKYAGEELLEFLRIYRYRKKIVLDISKEYFFLPWTNLIPFPNIRLKRWVYDPTIILRETHLSELETIIFPCVPSKDFLKMLPNSLKEIVFTFSITIYELLNFQRSFGERVTASLHITIIIPPPMIAFLREPLDFSFVGSHLDLVFFSDRDGTESQELIRDFPEYFFAQEQIPKEPGEIFFYRLAESLLSLQLTILDARLHEISHPIIFTIFRNPLSSLKNLAELHVRTSNIYVFNSPIIGFQIFPDEYLDQQISTLQRLESLRLDLERPIRPFGYRENSPPDIFTNLRELRIGQNSITHRHFQPSALRKENCDLQYFPRLESFETQDISQLENLPPTLTSLKATLNSGDSIPIIPKNLQVLVVGENVLWQLELPKSLRSLEILSVYMSRNIPIALPLSLTALKFNKRPSLEYLLPDGLQFLSLVDFPADKLFSQNPVHLRNLSIKTLTIGGWAFHRYEPNIGHRERRFYYRKYVGYPTDDLHHFLIDHLEIERLVYHTEDCLPPYSYQMPISNSLNIRECRIRLNQTYRPYLLPSLEENYTLTAFSTQLEEPTTLEIDKDGITEKIETTLENLRIEFTPRKPEDHFKITHPRIEIVSDTLRSLHLISVYPISLPVSLIELTLRIPPCPKYIEEYQNVLRSLTNLRKLVLTEYDLRNRQFYPGQIGRQEVFFEILKAAPKSLRILRTEGIFLESFRLPSNIKKIRIEVCISKSDSMRIREIISDQENFFDIQGSKKVVVKNKI